MYSLVFLGRNLVFLSFHCDHIGKNKVWSMTSTHSEILNLSKNRFVKTSERENGKICITVLKLIHNHATATKAINNSHKEEPTFLSKSYKKCKTICRRIRKLAQKNVRS